jgi:2-hydroxycyclohexanecarboxyl-CoA dehydrogenase
VTQTGLGRPDPVLGTFGRGALAGRACIVTGAGSGMGRAIALRFAEAGATVAMADVSAEGLGETEGLLRSARSAAESVAVTVDLAEPEACRHLAARAFEAAGRLDVVVNCAGVGGVVGTVESHAPEEWRRVLEVNLGSVYAVCRAALPHLRAAGDGAIINFGSAAAYRGSAAMPSHVYAASKGGVVALTRAMAASYGGDRIRVNAIIPGLVRTAMTERLVAAAQRVLDHGGGAPIGRIGEPDDAAGCALFLASDAAAYVTGVALFMDGGAAVSRWRALRAPRARPRCARRAAGPGRQTAPGRR